MAAIAAIVSAWIFYSQLNEMRDEQRPWIGAPKISAMIVGDEIRFKNLFTNVGHIGTNGLDIQAKIESGDWQKFAKAFCLERKKWIKEHKKFFLQFSAIPGSPYPTPTPTGYKVANIKAIPNAFIVGCVTYGWRGDNILHQTGYVAGFFIEGSTVSVDDPATVEAN